MFQYVTFQSWILLNSLIRTWPWIWIEGRSASLFYVSSGDANDGNITDVAKCSDAFLSFLYADGSVLPQIVTCSDVCPRLELNLINICHCFGDKVRIFQIFAILSSIPWSSLLPSISAIKKLEFYICENDMVSKLDIPVCFHQCCVFLNHRKKQKG